jgi:hypothetical protein
VPSKIDLSKHKKLGIQALWRELQVQWLEVTESAIPEPYGRGWLDMEILGGFGEILKLDKKLMETFQVHSSL